METVVLAVGLEVQQSLVALAVMGGLAVVAAAAAHQKVETAALAEQVVAGGCSSSQCKENQ